MAIVRVWMVMFLLLSVCTVAGFPEEKEEKKSKGKEKQDTEYYRVKKSEVVVVTATMSPRALKDCAASVNVVGKRDMELLSSGNALDILAHVPGIFVTRTGDFGRADVDIRGLGQNCRRVAVLVDGKPEKMGLFGCAVSHAFPLDNVERIEVVKGPASVLYGGEALGGAVNIITRTPEKKFETDLSVMYGGFNTRRYQVKHGADLDKFKYFFTYDRRRSDGHLDHSGYTGDSFTGKLVYDINASARIVFQGKYFGGKKHEPGTIDHPVTNFWNDYRRGAVDVSLTRRWDQGEWSVKFYRNFGRHQFSDGWDSRDHTNGVMARYTTRGITNNELTIGGDIRYFGGRSLGAPLGAWDKKEGSVFVQNDYILNTRWIFSSGLRLQWDSLYGGEWCPQLGVVFQAGRHTSFRGVIGKGFRSPQLNELYMFPPANPGLEPERVWNYEVGFDRHIVHGVTLKGSVFHMKGSNLIRTAPNGAPPPMFIFANTGEFSFYGAEVELDAVLTRHLSGHISHSYMDYGDHTKGRPGRKTDFSLRFGTKRLSAMLQGRYVTDYYAADRSESPIPSYFLLNSRVILTVSKGFDIIVDMNNLLNESYSIYGEFPGLTAGLYRMPGRNIQVGFKFSPH